MKKHTLYYIKLLGCLIFTGDFKSKDQDITFIEGAFFTDLFKEQINVYAASKSWFMEKFNPIEITEANYQTYLHKNNPKRVLECIDEIENNKMYKHRGYKLKTEYDLLNVKKLNIEYFTIKGKYKFII